MEGFESLEDVPLEGSQHTFKGTKFDGKEVAVKKIRLESTMAVDNGQLVALKNENIVSYQHCFINESFRYLVMDLCLGSMLDFCLNKLSKIGKENLDIGKIMWGTLRGLEYLHENGIVHGCLTLEKILLCQLGRKQTTAKLTGYAQCSKSREDDLYAFANVSYLMAISNDMLREHVTNSLVPTPPVSASVLMRLDKKQRCLASRMINLLLPLPDLDSKLPSVKTVMKHPFFTTNLETARRLLNFDAGIKNVEELEKFYKSIPAGANKDKDSFDGLMDLFSSDYDISEIVTTALEDYRDVFLDFFWHFSLLPPLTEPLAEMFVIDKSKGKLGEGSYGKVVSGNWTTKTGAIIPAAGKILLCVGNEVQFEKEFQILQDLDHLFIVSCFGMCNIKSKKCIVMELCEGSLDLYVSEDSKLEDCMPKNRKNDRILLGQVILGLAYLHSKKIIHKDLKPRNILLWRRSLTSKMVVAKIADFGYVRQLKPGRTETSATLNLGTVSYRAPELQGEEKASATFQSDAYSLGVTIAYTIIGKHPYQVPGQVSFLQSYLMGTGCHPSLPDHLKWDEMDLILQLIKKDPKERPDVALVIYHPYFVLANENATNDFEEKINTYFDEFANTEFDEFANTDFDDPRIPFFSKENLRLWEEMTTMEKNPVNTEAKQFLLNMSSVLEIVKELASQMERSYENYLKTKDVIKPSRSSVAVLAEHLVTHNCGDIFKLSKRNSMRKILLAAPEFVVTYIWRLLTDKTELPPYFPAHSKPSEECVFQVFKMNEFAFGCLHMDEIEKQELWDNKGYSNRISSDEDIHFILRELWPPAVPTPILTNMIERLKNINSSPEESIENVRPRMVSDRPTILKWVLKSCWWSELTSVKDILEKGGDPNYLSNDKYTAIHMAAFNQSESASALMKLLLQYGGNPNAESDSKITPVHLVARNQTDSAPALMALLLENDGNPNAKSDSKITPVHLVAHNETDSAPALMELLLQYGGNPNAESDSKITPVHLVARNQTDSAPALMALLLENDGNPNAESDSKITPVHLVADNESDSAPALMELLLENGGNTNAEREDKSTPVHVAARNKSRNAPALMKLLLGNHGNPNAESGSKITPVHLVADNESDSAPALMELLLKNGGNPNTENVFGKNPLHYAASNESNSGPALKEMLLEFGGRILEV